MAVDRERGISNAQSTVHLGRRFRALRKRCGLTQQEAAAAAGITRNTLSTLERLAFPDPALRTLLGLQRAYGLSSIEELLGGEDMPSRELADVIFGALQLSRPRRIGA